MSKAVKLFLASSAELEGERREFEIFINRKNKEWHSKGIFIELIIWEDFLDAVAKTRLQDKYNEAIRACDIFVMLYFTKVGKYTEEEFETAVGQFQANDKPFVFTYFKDAAITTASANKKDLTSLWAFQEKLAALGHFYTTFKNVDELKFKFNQQLEKLAAEGFIVFHPDDRPDVSPRPVTYNATVTGSGAVAQGDGSIAGGADAVVVGGNVTGNITNARPSGGHTRDNDP